MSKSKRRIREILIVLLAFIITLAAVVANVALRRVVEEGRRAEVLLLQLQGFAYRLSAFEWQAVSERGMSSKIVAGVQGAQDEMKRTMGSLEQLDANAGNLRLVRQLLTAIKQMGVRIAIDDFGIGYSSLAQIKRFPIDTLKVDRSFIRDLAENAEDRAITEAIITMGKTLSLTVVAEGVETQEQQSFLSDHACDAMQGFYFSKPIPHDEFASFMRQRLALSR